MAKRPKEEVSLAKATGLDVLAVANDGQFVFSRLAKMVTADLAPAPAGGLLKLVRGWTKVLEDAESALKQRLIALLKEGGQPTEGTTAYTLEQDGVRISMHRTRTGFDPKRVEAILRAKGRQPSDYMDATITYKVNEEKLMLAVGQGYLTVEELEATCRYPESWTLKTPEKAHEGGNDE